MISLFLFEALVIEIVSKLVGVVICIVIALLIYAISAPLGLNVLKANEEVGRVDCGFVNTADTLKRITVFKVASDDRGLLKLNKVPLPLILVAEHGVDTKEDALILTEHALETDVRSTDIYCGTSTVIYPPDWIGYATLYCKLYATAISLTISELADTETRELSMRADVAVIPEIVPVATRDVSVDR